MKEGHSKLIETKTVLVQGEKINIKTISIVQGMRWRYGERFSLIKGVTTGATFTARQMILQ